MSCRKKGRIKAFVAQFFRDLQSTPTVKEATEISSKTTEDKNSSCTYKLIPITIEYRPPLLSNIPESDPRRIRYLEIHSDISQQI